MIRHLFRLVWNRRKRNGLIMVEILVSFLLLCAIFTMGSSFLLNWNEPLGFDSRDVWSMSVGAGPYHDKSEEQQLAMRRTLSRLEEAVRGVPDVEAAAMQTNVPYTNSRWRTTVDIDGEQVAIGLFMGTRDAPEVLRLGLVDGRLFDESDANPDENHVILTEDYARMLFPDRSAVGRLVPAEPEEEGEEPATDEEAPKPKRIVGVIHSYRGRGEHRPAEPQMLQYIDWETFEGFPPRSLLVRVRPGSPVQLEEDLLEIASAIAPEWTFTVTRMEDMRARMLKSALMPLGILAVVGVFLILMVGLGLIGVLWQSVIRRTEEIGVRRAMGATAGAVRVQFLGELLALTTLSVLLGSVLYLQFPLLGLLDERGAVVACALGASLVVMYGFVFVCGLYPSWLATRIEPARALGYE
ncbi:ABC transporter permease [bacterium]|nr:ABC transporter permease [bacterium]